MNVMNKLQESCPKTGQITLVWLGQAGFLLRASSGACVAVDPYLSHCGERRKNFIRMSPILIAPEELDVDAVLVTHKHFDHFDYDAMPFMAANKKTQFWGPASCVKEFEELNIEDKTMNLLKVGRPEEIVAPGITAKAVFADHGDMEPDAVGIVLRLGEITAYITGDTAYRPEKMIEVRSLKPDLIIASINGEFGNLTPESGAQLAVYTQAKAFVPCHFWTFKEHRGRPDLLEEALAEQGCDAGLLFMTPGEPYTCERVSGNLIFSRSQKLL